MLTNVNLAVAGWKPRGRDDERDPQTVLPQRHLGPRVVLPNVLSVISSKQDQSVVCVSNLVQRTHNLAELIVGKLQRGRWRSVASTHRHNAANDYVLTAEDVVAKTTETVESFTAIFAM